MLQMKHFRCSWNSLIFFKRSKWFQCIFYTLNLFSSTSCSPSLPCSCFLTRTTNLFSCRAHRLYVQIFYSSGHPEPTRNSDCPTFYTNIGGETGEEIMIHLRHHERSVAGQRCQNGMVFGVVPMRAGTLIKSG